MWFIFIFLSLNSHGKEVLKRSLGINKNVSNVRKFKTVTLMKLSQLKTRQLKRRTFNKMQWAVKAFTEWRSQRLASNSDNVQCDIFHANLHDTSVLTKQQFKNSMCMFIPEVTKIHDGSDYPGKALYEMVTSIQKFLHEHMIYWKLLEDAEFT